ncbi:MDIS1-interacting receptor like kinase 1 [Vitis vinifera]|uniref:MDIS1-interacting receptor like kinase 1 n=1 Tax=Vitis vinifera TaxID=29760 RepID=A0A438K8V8_VITVI|nr:MDIS1-interacting receptor like kinase 1 [Vitis vinifera]
MKRTTNKDDERSILLDVNNNSAIHRHSNRGIPHPRPAISEKIPATICDLKNLIVLDLSNNDIPGEFPDILNCSKLEYLRLLQNFFAGPIPADIDRLSRLRYLDLTANFFSGDIPAAIGRLRELFYLFLVENEFNGTWPTEIGNLANLEQLAMAYNDKFMPSALPKEFGALKKLKYLWMTDANLIGEIPESFNNLSSLEHLDLSLNKLEGTIPGGMLTLKNLTNLYLFNNRLSGRIPLSIEALNLKEIDLSKNYLTGPIPTGFGKLQNLTGLNLFWNQLSGEIPTNISLIPTLETFKVFSNQLSGVLPPAFGLHSELKSFEVSENKLSGELPQHLCARGALLGVVASNNNLSGKCPSEIPSGIWTSPDMVWLMLAGNSFSGTLPSKLARYLSRVEISNNKFSGPIPTEISSWMNIAVLNASNNMLSGKIPVEFTSLWNISVLLLDGNQFSGVVFFTLFMVRDYHRKNHSRDHTTWKLTPFQNLDFDEQNILSGLTENNLIGRGGSGELYRIANNRSGELLAYMEKQSLDRWIHGKKQRTSSMTSSVHNFVLDWPTRLQIAIGAAEGLRHMHEYYSAPIIHRDVKSSNILLDAEFNAKIADFGLAKMLVKRGEPNTMSGIAGSYGYIAPGEREDRCIQLWSSLAELVSGREPNSVNEHKCLVEWAWDQFREEKSIEEVVDEEIKEQCDRAQVTTLFNLGVRCTQTSPSDRPTMKKVLEILQRCSQHSAGPLKKEKGP